jgi:hypothetical protein
VFPSRAGSSDVVVRPGAAVRSRRGRTSVTRVPEGRETTASSPPASRACACIPVMPKPIGVVLGSNPWPSSRTSPTRRSGPSVRVTRACPAPLCLATLCSASRRTRYATRSSRDQARRGTVRSSTANRIPVADPSSPAVAVSAPRRSGRGGAGRSEPRISSRRDAISWSSSRRRSSPRSRGSGPGSASAPSIRMRAMARDWSTVSWSRWASRRVSYGAVVPGSVITSPGSARRRGRRCPTARSRPR